MKNLFELKYRLYVSGVIIFVCTVWLVSTFAKSGAAGLQGSIRDYLEIFIAATGFFGHSLICFLVDIRERQPKDPQTWKNIEEGYDRLIQVEYLVQGLQDGFTDIVKAIDILKINLANKSYAEGEKEIDEILHKLDIHKHKVNELRKSPRLRKLLDGIFVTLKSLAFDSQYADQLIKDIERLQREHSMRDAS